MRPCNGKCGTKARPQLRWRVTVQKPDVSEESRNDYDENDLSAESSWKDMFTRRAAIRNAAGRERFEDDQTIATRNVMVELMGDKQTRQISTTYRLRYRDRDGVQHTLGIVERRVSEDGNMVQLGCVEQAR